MQSARRERKPCGSEQEGVWVSAEGPAGVLELTERGGGSRRG